MKQFTLYDANGDFVDQVQVYGNPNAQAPEGWVETTGQTFDPEKLARAKLQPVSRRQMLLALHRLGMLAGIEAGVALADDETQLSWREATVFERTDPLLNAMATALGKTPAEVDGVFVLAGSL